jgi:hypothetical protein
MERVNIISKKLRLSIVSGLFKNFATWYVKTDAAKLGTNQKE